MDLDHPANGVDTQDDHEQKVLVTVEVCLKTSSAAASEDVASAVLRFLQSATISYRDGPLDFSAADNSFLQQHVETIKIADTDSTYHPQGGTLLPWHFQPQVYVYQLDEDGAADDEEGEDGVPSYREWALPSRECEGLWESLHYDQSIKRSLLRYAATALLFSEKRVNTNLISWNRVVLLHGPPGTGKTSLCKALAQKLAIQFNKRYTSAQLVEVNAHSLFSKWFSESGKLVSRLFGKITEIVEDEEALVFVLIDEVESLTSARKAAVSGSEPSDAIRAVNALLTQLDALKRFPNVMVLTTSNITEAIDLAFVDRADIKAYIGPPSVAARYEILRSSMQELCRAGIIAGEPDKLLLPLGTLGLKPDTLSEADGTLTPERLAEATTLVAATAAAADTDAWAAAHSSALLEVAAACEGLSGRALRKMPFLAHARGEPLPVPCSCLTFLRATRDAALQERQDRQHMVAA